MIPAKWRGAAKVVTAVAALAGVGCQATTSPRIENIQALSVEDLAYSIARLKGQTVRICGRIVPHQAGIWRVEEVRSPEPVYFHGRPAVLVVPCARSAPKLDRDGFITGRIARKDGSLDVLTSGIVVVDDAPLNHDWFLHAQCR